VATFLVCALIFTRHFLAAAAMRALPAADTMRFLLLEVENLAAPIPVCRARVTIARRWEATRASRSYCIASLKDNATCVAIGKESQPLVGLSSSKSHHPVN
jgi:hypothetical protein